MYTTYIPSTSPCRNSALSRIVNTELSITKSRLSNFNLRVVVLWLLGVRSLSLCLEYLNHELTRGNYHSQAKEGLYYSTTFMLSHPFLPNIRCWGSRSAECPNFNGYLMTCWLWVQAGVAWSFFRSEMRRWVWFWSYIN